MLGRELADAAVAVFGVVPLHWCSGGSARAGGRLRHDRRFTSSAKEFAAQNPKRVVLINGRRLARLMVRRDVGVRVRDPHRLPILIKRIDESFLDQT